MQLFVYTFQYGATFLLLLLSLIACSTASSVVVGIFNASMDTAFMNSMSDWTCESGSSPSACVSGDYSLGDTWYPHTEGGHLGMWFVSTGGGPPRSLTGTLESPPVDVADYNSITLSFTIGVGGTSACVSNYPMYELIPLIYNNVSLVSGVLSPSAIDLTTAASTPLTNVSFEIDTSSFTSTLKFAINRTTTGNKHVVCEMYFETGQYTYANLVIIIPPRSF